MEIPKLQSSYTPITNRDPSNKKTDISAARAIAEAAVHVELFTIPLYMTTLYSIQGMHQITSKGTDYYKGRLWPGSAPVAYPKSNNELAYNSIFSVFIQEMLHLQLASNLTSAIGGKPTFTGAPLQNKEDGWTCYGDKITTIPYIIDLKDTDTYNSVTVKLGPLDENQIQLFCAIEQPEDVARQDIVRGDYFPPIPLSNWKPEYTEANLPMFGTIGYLYEALAKYLTIQYNDGTTLWDELYCACSIQRDIFNGISGGHPMAEFPNIATQFQPGDDAKTALGRAEQMINAIMDQGEGSTLDSSPGGRFKGLFPEGGEVIVEDQNQPSQQALQIDYQSFNDSGQPMPQSADGNARYYNAQQTHYERFQAISAYMDQIYTWQDWHNDHGEWTAKDLFNDDYDAESAPSNIPPPAEVAQALNNLKLDPKMPETMSKVATGAIAGVTRVLDTYWTEQGNGEFPYPSMAGSGDRIAIYWAVFGETPDLSQGVAQPKNGILYHACQGLSAQEEKGKNNCAAIEVFHTCRGSNSCKAQGGCGFAQLTTGGGSCNALRIATPTVTKGGGVLCGGPTPSAKRYSAPSDNKCGSFGGCAVPISASQLYPNDGTMQLYEFEGSDNTPVELPETIPFKLGDSVYDIAWEAYCKANNVDPGTRPPPANDLRKALPPST